MVVDDLVGSFPVGAQFALCRVFGGYRHFPQDQVPDLKMPRLDFGVVVLCHQVLITRDLLLYHRFNFIQKI